MELIDIKTIGINDSLDFRNENRIFKEIRER
jgi:hypothetical protein